jgi:hypothetical protein
MSSSLTRSQVAIIVFLIFIPLSIATRTANAGVPRGEEGFLLGGNAQNALDPENPANEVIQMNTLQPPLYGTVSRTLNVKIAQLENMLEFKSYFPARSCGGGSPRIQLAIDLDGDGISDGNAFGYTAPPFAGCPPNRWQYDDLTDELPRWDFSQLASGGFTVPNCPPIGPAPLLCPFQTHSGYIPWPVFKAVLTTLFPAHRVCSGALVDDSGWMAEAGGVAYYDIISMGRATWEDHEDSIGRGFAHGCGRPPHDDREEDGDKDHDHERTQHDDEFDRKRHERWDR